MKWFLLAFKNIFNYRDRARRAEFGWFLLINFLIQLALAISVNLLESLTIGIGLISTITLIYQLVSSLCSLSLTTRRLHDLGKSGWWQVFFYLLPISIVILAVIFILGNPTNIRSDEVMAIFTVLLAGAMLISIGFSLFLIFKDGQRLTNKYGDDPKATPQTSSLEISKHHQ